MKKTMTKAVTLTATATMLIGTIPFTATSVLAGEKYPAIATYNEIGQAQTNIYDELEALAPQAVNEQEEVQTATQDLEVVTPEAPELDTENAATSGTWGTCAWNIDDNGVLTISGGTGKSNPITIVNNPPNSYSPTTTVYPDTPWVEIKDEIKKINITGNINFDEDTSLCNLFKDLTNVTEINGLDKLDTSNVTNMYGMFDGCSSLTTLDVSKFNTEKVEDMVKIFYDCNSLTKLDLSNFDLSSIQEVEINLGYFTSAWYKNEKMLPNTLTEITMPKEFGSKSQVMQNIKSLLNSELQWIDEADGEVYDGVPNTIIAGHKYIGKEYEKSGTWGTCAWSIDDDGVLTIKSGVGENIEKVEKTVGDTKITDYQTEWKHFNSEIKKVNIEGTVKFNENTSLAGLFNGLDNLQEINGLSNLDTTNVTDMSYMFSGCKSLTELDLSSFNLDKITNISYLFSPYIKKIKMPNSLGSETNRESNISAIKDCMANKEWKDITSNKSYDNKPDTLEDNHEYSVAIDGTWGTCTWKFNDGELTISGGTGKSNPVTTKKEPNANVTDTPTVVRPGTPWAEIKDEIKTINITGNINFDEGTSLCNLFSGLTNVTEINGLDKLDTSNVTNMYGMFNGCSSLTTLDVSKFNTEKVADMEYIFSGCTSLTKLDLSNFDLRAIERGYESHGLYMSSSWYKNRGMLPSTLTEITIPKNICIEENTYRNNEVIKNIIIGLSSELQWTDVNDDKTYFGVPDTIIEGHKYIGEEFQKSGTWGNCEWSIDDEGVLTIKGGVGESVQKVVDSNGTTTYQTPWNHFNSEIKKVNIEDKVTFKENTSLSGLFKDIYGLQEINGLDKLDTTNVTDMSSMFYGRSGLTALDVSGFNTANVTDMSSMFYGCSGLTALDIKGFNTANVTNMSSMFGGCSGLTALDVSGFNTTNVTNMSSMFGGCSGLTALDVSGFNTVNVTNMRSMFYGCSGLTVIDVSGFNTTNVTDMRTMFSGCSGITSLNLHNFDLSSIETGSEWYPSGMEFWNCVENLFSDTVKEITMPKSFGTTIKDENIEKLISCMSDVSWTDRTAKVKYDGKPDTLIEGHRYVVTGSEYDKDKEEDNKTDDTNKDDTNKDNNNTGKDDTNKDNNNTGKDDTNKDNNNTSKDDTNKDNSNISKDDTNKDNSNTSKDDTNKDNNISKDDTNKDNSNTSKDDVNKDNNNNASDDTNKDNNDNNNNNDVVVDNSSLSQNADGNWYYYVDGNIDTNYAGLAENEFGWWKITNGTVDFGYNGIADNKYGWWKVTNGTVDFSANGLQFDAGTDTWWYFNNGAIDFTYTGLAENEFGWWKVTDGKVDFTYNGLGLNEYGWWKVTNGAVDLNYNGLAENEYGWWKVVNGVIDFSANGLQLDEVGNKWWYFNNGAIDFNYNGLAENEFGWWKITNGAVDFTANGLIFDTEKNAWFYFNNGAIDFEYTGLAENEYGWWKIVNGTVDFTYTGLAENQYGWWYFNNGVIDFTYNGQADNQYGTWNVVNGHVEV